MARRQRSTSSGSESLNRKIDELNDSINNLIDTIERNSRNSNKNNNNESSRRNNSNFTRGVSFSSISRYTSNAKYRQEKLGQFSRTGQVMGRYMSMNSGKIGAKLFGVGKAGSVAAKGIGVMGKAVGSVSKLLGGTFVKMILYAIDALKMMGEVMNDWKEATAEMYRHQTQQEKFQYEQSKQQMLLENKMKIENVSAQGDIQLKMLDTQGATMLEALKLTTAQYAKSVQIALGPLTKGINESAYDAAMSSVDAAAQMEKLALHKGQREAQYGRFKELRELKQSGAIAGLEAEKGVVETQYRIDSQRAAMAHTQLMEREHNIQGLIRNERNNLLNFDENGNVTEDNKIGGRNVANGNQKSDVITNTNEAGVGGIMNSNMWGANWEKFVGYQQGQQAKQMAMGEYSWEKLRESADYNKAKTDAEYELATTEKDYLFQEADKRLEIAVQSQEIVIDTAAEVKKTWLQLAQNTEKWLENFDSVTNNLGINLGYTNKRQLHDYQTSMFGVVKDVAAKFGQSIEEVAKAQESYIQSTGRNKIMGQSDYGQLLGLGKYLGDNDLAASYASEMEIFNAGVSDSVDMLDETLQDVNKIGLNGRKYTKTLVDNLKLAQKYNFKGGTKGLMDMAKWAENTRFNLASLGGMLDKVMEGGLEGVITQGAQFQVLGGQAAMNADPLAMMFEAYADPEAYAKRMQDMTKGYGQLDRKTGETKFSGNEVMMMQQIAKIQGRSLEEVQNEVRARNKKEVVSKQLGAGFNDDQQAFISNNATYNKETGQFQVKVKGANGEYVDTDVNKLTQEDLKQIMPEGHNEKMEKYMQDVVSAVESMKGEEIAEKADIAAATYETMLNEFTERARIAHESYAQHRDQYIAETKAGMEAATKAFKDYIGIFDEGNKDVDESVKNIEGKANAIADQLDVAANIIAQANARMSLASGITYTAPTSNGKLTLPSLNFQTKQQEKPATSVGQRLGAEADVQRQQGNHAAANGLDRAAGRTFMWGIRDGIVSNGNNKPIVSQANNVTKINDGLVESDPKDVAIFAKEGGVIGNFLDNLYNDVHSTMGGSMQMDTVRVEISGNLELSSGGQSVNIINELQNNPILLRSLSRILSEHISSAMNGGRGTSSLAIGSV